MDVNSLDSLNSEEFSEDWDIVELINQNNYGKLNDYIGDDQAKARKVFSYYRALKGVEVTQQTITKNLLNTDEPSEQYSTIANQEQSSKRFNIREIVIVPLKDGIEQLLLLSGKEFLSSPATGFIRSSSTSNQTQTNQAVDVTDTTEKNQNEYVFHFKQFTISKNNIHDKNTKYNQRETKIGYFLEFKSATSIKVVEILSQQEIDEKDNTKHYKQNTLYQGKRIKNIQIPINSGSYEIMIDNQQWSLILG